MRSVKGARNSMVNLENLNDEELERLQEQFAKLGRMSVKKQVRAEE